MPKSSPDHALFERFLVERSELPLELPEEFSLRPRVVRAREPLIREGEESDRGYVVYSGLFEARAETPTSRRLGWLGVGSWTGEVGMLTGAKRMASVLAWRDSVVLEIDAVAARSMLTGDPSRLAALTAHLIRRGGRDEAARPRPMVLGVIPAGLDRGLIRSAAEQVEGIAIFDGRGWRDDDIAAILELEEVGQRGPLLLLIGDRGDSRWTRAVIRAADRVAFLGADDPGPGSLALRSELGLPGSARSFDLLLTCERASSVADVHIARSQDSPAYVLRPGSPSDLVDYLRTHVEENARPERLRRFDLFRGLDDAGLAQVQEALEWRLIEGGEQLIRTGDPSDGLFLVDLGRLQASVRKDDGSRLMLSESGPGEIVGDTGLILECPRTADVHAKRDSRVGFLSAAAFEELGHELPALGRNSARIASERTLQATSVQVGPEPDNLMVLRLDPCGRSEAFVDGLERCIREHLGRSVMLVTRAVVERALGEGAAELRPVDPGYRRLLVWFQRISRDHELVIFCADSTESGWARCCLRQTDRLLLVASAQASPELRSVEREFVGVELPRDLVLLQQAGISRAAGTRRWLAERGSVFVHHVRDGTPADIAATARRILGGATGIAFSGASTRGPAHTGVVRALVDLAAPVDIVAGTSSGSTIAGAVAMGMDPGEILSLTAGLSARSKVRLRDLQPPLVAFTDGSSFDEIFQESVGDVEVEDLLLPCRMSAVDLLTHELIYLDRGPLWRAMRASCSLPVIYPPVAVDGRLLVDGGLISYIPVGAILPSCERGLAIMSDINDPTVWDQLRKIEPYGTVVSGWRHLLDTLLPWRTPKVLPSIADTLFLGMITSNSFAADRLEAVLRHPAVCHVYQPLSGYGMYDVTEDVARKFEAMVYARAREVIGERLGRGAGPGTGGDAGG